VGASEQAHRQGHFDTCVGGTEVAPKIFLFRQVGEPMGDFELLYILLSNLTGRTLGSDGMHQRELKRWTTFGLAPKIYVEQDCLERFVPPIPKKKVFVHSLAARLQFGKPLFHLLLILKYVELIGFQRPRRNTR
jgi:hypothetical protein